MRVDFLLTLPLSCRELTLFAESRLLNYSTVGTDRLHTAQAYKARAVRRSRQSFIAQVTVCRAVIWLSLSMIPGMILHVLAN